LQQQHEGVHHLSAQKTGHLEEDDHQDILLLEAFELLTLISPKGIPSGDYALLRSP